MDGISDTGPSSSVLLLEPTFSTNLGLGEAYICNCTHIYAGMTEYEQNVHVQIKTNKIIKRLMPL